MTGSSWIECLNQLLPSEADGNLILPETEVPHHDVVCLSRYLGAGGGRFGTRRCQIWPSKPNIVKPTCKTLIAASWCQFQFLACHRGFYHITLPSTSTACFMPLDKPLLTSECPFSSISRQAWTRGQSIVIYSVLESSTWNFLHPPLVAMLCLGALILRGITLLKTPQGSIVWFFKIPHPKGRERTSSGAC